MKIALLAPPFLSIPPWGYGGTEKIIAYLADGLVDRGHEVTLFASGDSETKARLVSVFPKELGVGATSHSQVLSTLLHFSSCFKRQDEFDVIHNHGEYLAMFLASSAKVPVVHTLHSTYYVNEVPDENRMTLRYFRDQIYVSISKNQRKALPELMYAGMVYNGIQTSVFPFSEKPRGKYLFWAGRVSEKKGLLDAIGAAKILGMNLRIAARLDDFDREFFDQYIRPELHNDLISFHGELHAAQMADMYGGAIATLFPVTWHEPFGLVMIESMSSGTPVVAYDFGAVDEVVRDGETGYIVHSSKRAPTHQWQVKNKDVEGLVEAVQRLMNMNESDYSAMRRACRKRVEENFTAEKMVEGYERIYQTIITSR